jgi:hypothetical protein
MNELHASGAFYAAQLTRFKCQWCWGKCAFVVEMFCPNLGVGYSCCPECAARLSKAGWINTIKAYEAMP